MKDSSKKGLNWIIDASCVLFYFVYDVLLNIYGMGDQNSQARYFLLAAISVLTFPLFMLCRKKVAKANGNKGVKYIVLTALSFLAISLAICSEQGVGMPFRVYTQISLFLLPALYAYMYIKVSTKERIMRVLKIITCSSIVLYFCEPNHPFLSFFDPETYKRVNLFRFVSFTESSHFSDVFTQLYIIFNYMHLKNNDDRNIKKYKNISLIFALLSFKRLSIAFVIATELFSRFYYNKNSKRWMAYAAVIVLVIATVLYSNLLKGMFSEVSYEQVFDVTSGRNYILSLWGDVNYKSYGYGSSMLFIGRYLELDLVQIYMEIGIFALILFLYSYYKCSGDKMYNFVTTSYVLLNMLTASSLPWTNGTMMFFMGLFYINEVSQTPAKALSTKKVRRRIGWGA